MVIFIDRPSTQPASLRQTRDFIFIFIFILTLSAV